MRMEEGAVVAGQALVNPGRPWTEKKFDFYADYFD